MLSRCEKQNVIALHPLLRATVGSHLCISRLDGLTSNQATSTQVPITKPTEAPAWSSAAAAASDVSPGEHSAVLAQLWTRLKAQNKRKEDMAKDNQAPTRTRTSITIYASGRALVQGCYALRLAEGKNTFALEGMPAQFVPSSLYADQFEGPGEVTMGPITYRAANLNTANQLARSLNRVVTVVHGGNLPKEQDEVTGILLSYQG